MQQLTDLINQALVIFIIQLPIMLPMFVMIWLSAHIFERHIRDQKENRHVD